MRKTDFFRFRNTINLAAGIALAAAVLAFGGPGVHADNLHKDAAPVVTKIGFKHGGHGYGGYRHGKFIKFYSSKRYHRNHFSSHSGHHGRYAHRKHAKKHFYGRHHRSFHPKFSFGLFKHF